MPTGEEWPHEVKWDGMRVLVGRRATARRGCGRRNENDATVSFPELHAAAPGRRRCCSTARWSRSTTGLPDFGALPDRMHVARADRGARGSPSGSPVTLHGLRPAPPRRPRPDRRSRWPSAASCSTGLDLRRRPLAGARRRTTTGAMLFDATRQQGLEGIVSKRLSSRYRPGPAQQGLAEVPAPPPRVVRRRRLAPRDRLARPARRACSWASRPPTGCSTAAGSAAASPGKAAALLRELLAAARPRPTRRSPTRCRGSTPRAPHWVEPVARRRRRVRSGRPRRAGSASRRTVASAPT